MSKPEVLFHYCSNDAFCSIVNSNSIWLSSLSLSNDSMEGKWIRRILEEECKKSAIADLDIKEVLASFDFVIAAYDGLGFCLSESDDMLSQWRGYASNGEGVSIGFCGEYLSKGYKTDGNVSGFRLHQVSYGDLGQKNRLISVVAELKKASLDGLLSVPGLLTSPMTEEGWIDWRHRSLLAKSQTFLLLNDLFIVKNPAFAEEREWRLLSLDFRQPDFDVQFRSSGYAIVPYRSYPVETSAAPIKKVVLGPRNRSNESDVVRFLSLNGFKDVEVSRSTASYR